MLTDLQRELKWPIFRTGQLFRDYAKKKQFNLDLVKEQNDELTKKIDYQVRDMINSSGNLIVDGWMSGIMADGLPNVLKILLICEDEIRYQRFAYREKISLEEAKKRVEERQNNWFQKIEKIYKIDPKKLIDKNNYDLIIDTSNITPQEVLKKILLLVID